MRATFLLQEIVPLTGQQQLFGVFVADWAAEVKVINLSPSVRGTHFVTVTRYVRISPEEDQFLGGVPSSFEAGRPR